MWVNFDVIAKFLVDSSEDDIHSIAEELWLNCISEPGRVFYEKYIVVGFDGHIPSCEYVQGVIEYLGGNSSNYCVASLLSTKIR